MLKDVAFGILMYWVHDMVFGICYDLFSSWGGVSSQFGPSPRGKSRLNNGRKVNFKVAQMRKLYSDASGCISGGSLDKTIHKQLFLFQQL